MLTMFVQAVASIMYLGLNWTHCTGPGWSALNIATLLPVFSAPTMNLTISRSWNKKETLKAYAIYSFKNKKLYTVTFM